MSPALEQCSSFEGFFPHLLSVGNTTGNAEAWSFGQSWGEEVGHSMEQVFIQMEPNSTVAATVVVMHTYPDSINRNIWMYKRQVNNCQIWILA